MEKHESLVERLGLTPRAERNRRSEDIAQCAADILGRYEGRMPEDRLLHALGVSKMELRAAISYAGTRHKIGVWQGQYGMVPQRYLPPEDRDEEVRHEDGQR